MFFFERPVGKINMPLAKVLGIDTSFGVFSNVQLVNRSFLLALVLVQFLAVISQFYKSISTTHHASTHESQTFFMPFTK